MGQNHPKPPISSHGLFPTIVGIWFAALFGFGCLVLPGVLLDRVSDLSGIAALIPAAAPPLGITARIILAAGAGVFGALLGFVIARRVAGAQTYTPPARRERAPRFVEDKPAQSFRRPISAKEELGAAGFDASADTTASPPFFTALPGRKRPLTVAEESAPSDFPQLAPLPGQPMQWANEHQADETWADEHPLMASAATIAGKTIAPHADQRSRFAADSIDAERGMAALRNQPAETPAPAQADESELPEQASEPAAPQSAAPVADPLRALLAGHAAPVDKLSGPLERLGMVELAERLARSMRKREGGRKPPLSVAAELQRALLSPAPVPAAQASETVDAAHSPSFELPPAGIAPPPAIPRAFTPVLEDFGEDEDDFDLSLDLPFARTAPAFTHAADESDGEDRYDDSDEEVSSTAYSSLLTMKSPSRAPAEFVGAELLEESPEEPDAFEPTDVFTAQNPAPRPFDAPGERIAQARTRRDPVETERALRSALATLQRMSGTG